MRKTTVPLWLVCDPNAALRLWLATALLAMGCMRLAGRTSPPGPKLIAWVTVWLCCAETLLRWAIARHAFRLNGLPASRARIRLLSEAWDPIAWHRRVGAFIATAEDINRHARTMAKRMKEAMAGVPLPASSPEALEALEGLEALEAVAVFGTLPVKALSLRIRGPPLSEALPVELQRT